MVLYLLRHGASQTDADIPDHERTLTPEGVECVGRVARLIERMKLQFDVIYSSPLLRARQTAEIVRANIRTVAPIEVTEHLKVGSDYQRLFALLNLKADGARLLLVGHEPYLSGLVSTLLGGGLNERVDIRKGSLCSIETSRPIEPRKGMLKWLIPPEASELVF